MGMFDARSRHQRNVLAKLDRIATVSRGHRAGLHLDDPQLFEQYARVLSDWETEQPVPEDSFIPERADWSSGRGVAFSKSAAPVDDHFSRSRKRSPTRFQWFSSAYWRN